MITASSWVPTGTAEISALDAALATSAAPTYFPVHRVRFGSPPTRLDLVDGGVVANAPDVLAIHRAVVDLGFPEDRIALFSVGTCAFSEGGVSGETPAAYGVLGALRDIGGRGIVNLMMAVQERRDIDEARSKLDDRYLRIDECASKCAQSLHLYLRRLVLWRQPLEALSAACVRQARPFHRILFGVGCWREPKQPVHA